MIAFALALAAGLLTSLSPCVLPVLPIVVGSAGLRHRFGPLALAAGMVFAFTVVGVTLAAAGQAIGLDGAWLRRLAALALVLAGIFLLSERLQIRLSTWFAPLCVASSETPDTVHGVSGASSWLGHAVRSRTAPNGTMGRLR